MAFGPRLKSNTSCIWPVIVGWPLWPVFGALTGVFKEIKALFE